ncbi:hypothetical protein TNIN_489261 [Trichonephila inaurata madagascariensis]|uniref:Uncharacterized protein n=1 Tax=Trichonephila inaurata madagascariensis TaxID=2747483 RepID=A0A8X6YI52_9ARAC|nr:hypothetical protein TNIN_489261 [Trichonephila inaurata madagascariensis]
MDLGGLLSLSKLRGARSTGAGLAGPQGPSSWRVWGVPRSKQRSSSFIRPSPFSPPPDIATFITMAGRNTSFRWGNLLPHPSLSLSSTSPSKDKVMEYRRESS